MKYVASENLELDFDGYNVVSPIITGTLSDVIGEGHKLYYGNLKVQMVAIPHKEASNYICALANVTIKPSSKNMTLGGLEGSKALLEGDNAETEELTFIMPGTPPQEKTGKIKVTIKSAGQKAVQTE